MGPANGQGEGGASCRACSWEEQVRLVYSSGGKVEACSTSSPSARRCRLAPPRAGVFVMRRVRHAPLRAQKGLPGRARRDVNRRAGKCGRAEGQAGPVWLGVYPLPYQACEPPEGGQSAGSAELCGRGPGAQSRSRPSLNSRPQTPDPGLYPIPLQVFLRDSKPLPRCVVVKIF